MTLNTSALRRAWAPACQGKGDVFLSAYAALDRCLQKHRYAPRKVDTGAFNCRKITGGTGYSLHAYGPGDRFTFWNGLTIATSLAVDINWQSNPYGKKLVTDMPKAMVEDIKAIRTNSGAQVWGWGGDYKTNKDAMHFEIVCSPADLATGIANQITKPIIPPYVNPPFKEELTMSDIQTILNRLDQLERKVEDAITLGWVDEGTDIKEGERRNREYGSLRGWIVALAKKSGVTQADAVKEDPTHKDKK